MNQVLPTACELRVVLGFLMFGEEAEGRRERGGEIIMFCNILVDINVGFEAQLYSFTCILPRAAFTQQGKK